MYGVPPDPRTSLTLFPLLYVPGTALQTHTHTHLRLTRTPPSHQRVLTLELCTVMVVSKEAWSVLEKDHSLSACKVLSNLQQGCEHMVGSWAWAGRGGGA